MNDSRSPRARRKSAHLPFAATHPIGTPNGVSPNTGPLAAAQWLIARGLTPRESRWYAEIDIGTTAKAPTDNSPTVFRIEVFSEEWGYWFRHDGKVSWIRVTDLPFVHGRDDHGLLETTPALKNLRTLARALERRFELRFAFDKPVIKTSMFGAEPAIREWLATW